MNSDPADIDRRVVRHMIIALIAAVGVFVTCRIVSEVNFRDGAFDLRPTGLAVLFDFLFILVVFEVPVVLFTIAYDHVEIRRSLQVAAKVCLVLPLMVGSWHLLLAKFHAVAVEEKSITLEGTSTWANDSFPIGKIDRVEVHRGRLWDDLRFVWYDKIDASCGIYRFDGHAQRQLDALLAKFRERGIRYQELTQQ